MANLIDCTLQRMKPLKLTLWASVVLYFCFTSIASADTYKPIIQSKTLPSLSSLPLLWAYHLEKDSTRSMEIKGFTQKTRSHRDSAFFTPILGASFLQFDTNQIQSYSGRLQLKVKNGNFNAFADGAIYSEIQSPLFGSWDGEYIEKQSSNGNQESHSRLDYVSYSRYRYNLAYTSFMGSLSAARNSIHWGPAYKHALVLNQEALPFHHLRYSHQFGSFYFESVYGKLMVDGFGRFPKLDLEKNLYAHRYEWRPNQKWTVGVSETLILLDQNNPFAFIPFYPLFMEKGQTLEDNNNGSIALDIQWFPTKNWRLYSEFLIDDLSEPTSLFNDYWDNRWAVNAGVHYLQSNTKYPWGGIVECSRIEPWVYTHYAENSAQATHRTLPLGAQSGPNSFNLYSKVYTILNRAEVSLEYTGIKKGDDHGSLVNDTLSDNQHTKKEFLAGSPPLQNTLAFKVNYRGSFYSLLIRSQAEFTKADSPIWNLYLGTEVFY